MNEVIELFFYKQLTKTTANIIASIHYGKALISFSK